MIYSFIKNNEKLFPIEKTCKVILVSSGSYYRWKKQRITARLQGKNRMKEQITLIYFESKQRYGSPKITLELQSLEYKISRITVAKYMKQLGLRSKLSKKFNRRKCIKQRVCCKNTFKSLGFGYYLYPN